MKIFFLLVVASVLVLSCTKDVELQSESTVDLTATLAQYDDTNMGVYKGLFTAQGTMERGTIEINITPNNYGIATLKLVSGQEISFKADRKIETGAEVQGLQFNSSSVMASFKLSADMDGNNVVISDVVYKGNTSGAIAAHDTSRAPVTPITGILACDDCDAHPLLVTGDTGTFSLLFVGDGSANDTVTALTDVGVVVSTGGSQSGCVDGGTSTTCEISGSDLIGSNDIAWIGTHLYLNGSNCSEASGNWSLTSGNHGSYTGTFVSDVTCVSACSCTFGINVTNSAILFFNEVSNPCPAAVGDGSEYSYLPISDSGTIGIDSAIVGVEVDITHTHSGDVELSLVSPAGTELLLVADTGGSDDNFTGTIFADGGADIALDVAPFTGTYAAQGGTFAATFAGECTDGDWTLLMCDDSNLDSGFLNSFRLEIGCLPAPIFADQTLNHTNIQPEDIKPNK